MFRSLTLCVLLIAGLCPMSFARTWSDRSGKFRVQATLVTLKDGRAYLEREDGRVAAVPLDRLSVEDLRYLASLPEHATAVTPLLPAAPQAGRAADKPLPSRPLVKIRVADEAAAGEVRRYATGSWGITAVAFSPDGGMLALGRMDQAITLLDVNTMRVLSAHERLLQLSAVSCVAFSPDGSKLLVGGQQGVVQVWSVKGRRGLVPDKEFKIHDSSVQTIAISSDNRFALSGEQGNARYWKIATGEEVSGWEGFQMAVKGTLISSGGGQGLLTDGQILALADLGEGKLLQTMLLTQGIGQALAFSADGSYIALNNQYAMHVWETRTGKQLPGFPGTEIQWAAAFSPDARYLLASGNGKINVWSLESQQRVHQFATSDSGYVKSLAFSPDGIHFAATVGPISQMLQVFRLPQDLRP